MAVTKAPQTASVVIKVRTGLNDAGNPVIRSRSYKNVKTTAADADLYAIGQGIGSLQDYPVVTISRLDDANLISE